AVRRRHGRGHRGSLEESGMRKPPERVRRGETEETCRARITALSSVLRRSSPQRQTDDRERGHGAGCPCSHSPGKATPAPLITAAPFGVPSPDAPAGARPAVPKGSHDLLRPRHRDREGPTRATRPSRPHPTLNVRSAHRTPPRAAPLEAPEPVRSTPIPRNLLTSVHPFPDSLRHTINGPSGERTDSRSTRRLADERHSMAQRPTMHDVAAKAGVSQAVVSLVLSGRYAGRASEATGQRIR